MRNTLIAFCCIFAINVFGQSRKPDVTLETLAQLAARRPSAGELAAVNSFDTNRAWKSPRYFLHVPSSALAHDGYHVLTNAAASGRYVSLDRLEAIQQPEWFGAYGDGTHDDTTALSSMAAHIRTLTFGGFRQSGTYLVRSTGSTMSVLSFTNLTSFTLVDAGGRFVTDDFALSTFTNVSLTVTGYTATGTTAVPHGLTAGNLIVVQDSSTDGYQGDRTVLTIPTTNTFTFAVDTYRTPTTAGMALYRKSNTQSTLFRFVGCRNIDIGRLRFDGVAHDRAIQYRLGWIVAQFQSGCTVIRGSLDVTGAAYALWSGDYGTETGDSTDFDVSVNATSVGYPVALWGSGDDSKFRVVAEDVHRAVYAGGVNNVDFDIRVKNFDVAGLLLTTQPTSTGGLKGNHNVTYRVLDTGSTEGIDLPGVGAYRHLSMIAGYNIAGGVTNRSIKGWIELNNAPHTTGFYMTALRTNHVLDGITVGGRLNFENTAVTNLGRAFYVNLDSTSYGSIRGLDLSDLKAQYPTNTGGLTQQLVALRMDDNPILSGWETGIPVTTTLPTGIEAANKPVWPGRVFQSGEELINQRLSGGARINKSTLSSPMSGAPGTNAITVLWVGELPNVATSTHLFHIAPTNNTTAAAGSLVLKWDYGTLQVSQYGTAATNITTASKVMTNFAGRIASIGLSRANGDLVLYVNGHRVATTNSTSGLGSSWSADISGSYAVSGSTDYTGTLYRVALWNYDKSSEFPGLGTVWKSGELASGSLSYIMSPTVVNGGFETLGAGGADVFANWIEDVSGSSTVTASTNSHSGTYAAELTTDSSNNMLSVYQAPGLDTGVTYTLSFWAKLQSGSSATLAVEGFSGGEQLFDLTSSWVQYSATVVGYGSYIIAKRGTMPNTVVLLDDFMLRAAGPLVDFDWTVSPADLTSGKYAEASNAAGVRYMCRAQGFTVRNDDSPTLTSGVDAPIQYWTNVTSVLTPTLASTGARSGDMFKIVRGSYGSGSLTVAGVPVPVSSTLDVVYSGSAWTPLNLTSATIQWSSITNTPTTLSGYGITDAQPLDPDLAVIANTTGASNLVTGATISLHSHNSTGIADSTSAGRSLLTAVDYAAQRGLLGLGSFALREDAPTNGLKYSRKDGAWVTNDTAGTTYSAGTGLLLTGTTFSHDLQEGTNIVFTTNGNKLVINSTASGSSGGAGSTSIATIQWGNEVKVSARKDIIGTISTGGHSAGRTPDIVELRYVCVTNDSASAYNAGEALPGFAAKFDAGTNMFEPAFSWWVNSTNYGIQHIGDAYNKDVLVPKKSESSGNAELVAVNMTNWMVSARFGTIVTNTAGGGGDVYSVSNNVLSGSNTITGPLRIQNGTGGNGTVLNWGTAGPGTNTGALPGGTATNNDSIAFGYATDTGVYTNSVAIGRGATNSASNQIQFGGNTGGTYHTVVVPGILDASQTTWRGQTIISNTTSELPVFTNTLPNLTRDYDAFSVRVSGGFRHVNGSVTLTPRIYAAGQLVVDPASGNTFTAAASESPVIYELELVRTSATTADLVAWWGSISVGNTETSGSGSFSSSATIASRSHLARGIPITWSATTNTLSQTWSMSVASTTNYLVLNYRGYRQ